MIIFYGWKSDQIKCERIENAKCPHCQSQGSFIGFTYSRYFHIFWIPIFPYKKVTEFKCQNCGDTYEGKSLAKLLPEEYFNFRSNTRIPFFQFSGIFLIAGLITWIIISVQIDNKREMRYLQDPMIGDIYVYETDNGSYSTFKIIEFNSDSLIFLPNEYEMKSSSRINEINKSSNYSSDKYMMLRDTLNDLYKDGKIKDIIRE